MSWFSLNEPFSANSAVDPGDIVNTKTALNDLGYYDPPEGIGMQPWTDSHGDRDVLPRDNSDGAMAGMRFATTDTRDP